MNIRHIWLGVGLTTGLMLAGCTQIQESSPADIVSNLLDSDKQQTAYYGEGILRTYENDQLTEESTFKEWTDQNPFRKRYESYSPEQEVVTINDGSTIYLYDKTAGTAYSMESVVNDDEYFSSMNQLEQLINMLKTMKSTHQFEVVGEEKLLGLNTYHIEVKDKESASLLGDMELWVDQKSWFIVKTISGSEDFKLELEYTKLDFSPTFQDDTFTLDLPDNIEISPLEDVDFTRKITLEEAQSILGQPPLLLQQPDIELQEVELYELQGELDRPEISFTYTSEGVPVFIVSVFPAPDEDFGFGGKAIEVRGTTGEYADIINSISWDEHGLRYTVLVQDPELSVEETVEWINAMMPSS